MVEEAQDTEAVKTETPAANSPDIESQIKEAMRSRVNHFKEQADSLTFEGVRRLLEKDLELKEYALDVQKRFVKQCLVECLEGAVDDNTSKDSEEIGEMHTHLTKREAEESPEEHESKTNMKEPGSEDEEKMEDSPVMGLLTGKRKSKSETEETLVTKNKEVPCESSIKDALAKRASYLKANSENVTMAGVRRLLEEDLGLDKFALDLYKKYISKQLDEVLLSVEVSEPKKKVIKKSSQGKASKKSRTDESSESSDKESDEEDEDGVKPKKKISPKQKVQVSKVSRKRKKVEKEVKSGEKRSKTTEAVAEENSDEEGTVNASADSLSQSSAEKPVKKKEFSTPACGKQVEHLKSVIKSCGMSVPPIIYKKVKQVPESKREAQLIKELKEILSKEGLSSNPSEKEIKEVRKKKERAKELEGIDTSNIVSSSRRRSTTSYVPPPKPKIPVESDNSDADDTDEDDDEDDDNDEDEENEDGDNDGDDSSQSEEVNDDEGEDIE